MHCHVLEEPTKAVAAKLSIGKGREVCRKTTADSTLRALDNCFVHNTYEKH